MVCSFIVGCRISAPSCLCSSADASGRVDQGRVAMEILALRLVRVAREEARSVRNNFDGGARSGSSDPGRLIFDSRGRLVPTASALGEMIAGWAACAETELATCGGWVEFGKHGPFF